MHLTSPKTLAHLALQFSTSFIETDGGFDITVRVENPIAADAELASNIAKTLDGKKLTSGNYIMSVVSEGKTASILFTIK